MLNGSNYYALSTSSKGYVPDKYTYNAGGVPFMVNGNAEKVSVQLLAVTFT